MTTLGNIEASSLAALTFLDFESGDILYLSGTAKNLVGQDALKLMPRQNVLTTIHIEACIFVQDVFPIRQHPGSVVEKSPYCPPIRLLSEELDQSGRLLDNVSLTLTGIEIHSPSLATFHFESSSAISILPGQAAVLDFTRLFGKQQYAHMAPGREASLNDDRVRTWTVSSSHSSETRNFSLTMREKPDGLVTGGLFTLARRVAKNMPHILLDSRPLELSVDLLGISGSFTLPPIPSTRKLLWCAGGVGVTPFLSMLGSLNNGNIYDIIFVLSTNEPGVFINLISRSIPTNLSFNIKFHLFTRQASYMDDGLTINKHLKVVEHKTRLDEGELASISDDISERLLYICGPPTFENLVIEALCNQGLNRDSVIREGFLY